MSDDQPDDRRSEPADSSSSRELLHRMRAGDSQAANRLFARHLPQLRRWAHGRMPSWARGIVDTGDIVQDAVLHTFKRLPGFEPQRDGALLGYLRRVLLNRIKDQFRYVARHPAAMPLDSEASDRSESPFELAATQEARERYRLALKRLKPDDRNAIVARLELGYTYEQLALVVNKPTTEAARLAVRRALFRLAREMERV